MARHAVIDEGSAKKPLLSRILPLTFFVIGTLTAVVLLWHTIISVWFHGGSLSDYIKRYYLGDQLTYMSIMRNVADGKSAYLEPFTETGHSIYPSTYYDLGGHLARWLNLDIYFVWNVLGIAVTVALCVVCAFWGRMLSRSNWGFALGPLPLLIGLVTVPGDAAWKIQHGGPVLWPAFAILNSPNAESAGLVVALLGFFLLTGALLRNYSLRWLAGAGLLLGFTLTVHTYVALFGFTVAIFAYLIREITDFGKITNARRALHFVLGLLIPAVGAVLALAFNVIDGSLTILAIVLIFATLAIFAVTPRFKMTLRRLIVLYAAMGIGALPIIFRVGSDLRSDDSFFKFRQTVGQNDAVSLTVHDVILYSLPVLLLAVFALVFLGRSNSQQAKTWFSLILATLLGGGMLTFNAAIGMNQEPYRFYPYTFMVLLALGLPWLISAIGQTNWARVVQIGLRSAVAVLLLFTIPSAVLFFTDNKGLGALLTASAGEKKVYQDMATATASDDGGLTLLDTCFPIRNVKVLSGIALADYNKGLANPANKSALDEVIYYKERAQLPPANVLRAANVDFYATFDGCAGPSQQLMTTRYGTPRTIAFNNPTQCNLAEGSTVKVYDLRNDKNSSTPLGASASEQGPRPLTEHYDATVECSISRMN